MVKAIAQCLGSDLPTPQIGGIEMTMIAVRPQDRAEAQSPLERKMARARPLFLDQRVLEAVAQESTERLIKLGQKLQNK